MGKITRQRTQLRANFARKKSSCGRYCRARRSLGSRSDGCSIWPTKGLSQDGLTKEPLVKGLGENAYDSVRIDCSYGIKYLRAVRKDCWLYN